MRVLLALFGMMLLGYVVADRVRHLPGRSTDKVPSNVVAAVPAAVKVTSEAQPARVAPQPEPAKPEPAKPAAEAAQPAQRTNPVALVPLDPNKSRYPASPSDPVGEFAMVLPAPVESGGQPAASNSEARGRPQDPSTDLTGDLTHLRLAWPHQGSASAYAPSDPSASPVSPAGGVSASAPAAERAGEPSRTAAVEPPTAPAEPTLRGLPENPTETTPVPPARAATPAVPRARGESAPRPATRSGARAARTQQLPPPPRRLASAYASAGSDRPSLVCNAPVCGPRLLLLGVGF